MMNSALRCLCAVLTLLVFSISTAALEVHSVSNPSRVTLFSAASKVPYVKSDGASAKKKVHSFRIPSLVQVNGVLVAIADARYESSDDVSSIDIVAKYSVDKGQTWKTEVIIKNSGASALSRVVEPTVVVKGNKIYVLVASFNTSATYWTKHNDGSDWDPLLVVGEVSLSSSDDATKTASIKWADPVSLKDQFMKKTVKYWRFFIGGTSTGLLMRNGNIVFPIQILTPFGILPSIMYSNDNGKTWTFAKSSLYEYGNSEPSLVEWGNKLIMNCRTEDGVRTVYESSNMGVTWAESTYRLSGVWGNAPYRTGPGIQGSFIAVEIKRKCLMLFTLPLNTKTGVSRDKLNLWMTDNNRIFNVGQISHGDENTGYSSLMYHGGKLYCAHEVNNTKSISIVLETLDKQLALIKSTIQSWTQSDNKLSDFCIPAHSGADARGRKSCVNRITTSGLVGWLSGDVKCNTWKDVYGCVDAKITNAVATPHGARFHGIGAGVLWPVDAQGQNQRYRFAEQAFTLAAVVSIHKVPESGKSYPMMSASWVYDGQKEAISLSYNSNRLWVPEYGAYDSTPTKLWEPNRTYHVAISHGSTIRASDCGIYVDGECIVRKIQMLDFGEDEEGIQNFYIGNSDVNHNSVNGYITVSNVMLYNRKLSDNEIKALSRIKDMINEQTTAFSPSGSLHIGPSLSHNPSAEAPKVKASSASPGATGQTNVVSTNSAAGSSTLSQGNVADVRQNNTEKPAQGEQTAIVPPPSSIDALPVQEGKVSTPSAPAKPAGGDATVVREPNNSSALPAQPNSGGNNPDTTPKDSSTTAAHTKENIQQNTEPSTSTTTSTSTGTSKQDKARPTGHTGADSTSGLNSSQGAEHMSDPLQTPHDGQKMSHNGASETVNTAVLPQPSSGKAAPLLQEEKVSSHSVPAKPAIDDRTVLVTPKENNEEATPTNSKGSNPTTAPKGSSTAAPTKQKANTNTEINTTTTTTTSTSTTDPIKARPTNDTSVDSASGWNPSQEAEGKSDPPQAAGDGQKASNNSASDAAGRAHDPLLLFLMSALLGFATLC